MDLLLFKVTAQSMKYDDYLLRIFGQELHLSWKKQREQHKQMAKGMHKKLTSLLFTKNLGMKVNGYKINETPN